MNWNLEDVGKYELTTMQKKLINRWAAVAALISAPFYYAPHSQAQDASKEDINKLLRRIDELEQKVKVMERNREVDQETAAEKAKTTPTVSLGAAGLVIRSADSNFVMNVHGYRQADGRFFLNDRETANDTFLLRRVRPIIEGSVFDKFDYCLMLDFGSGNGSSSTAGNNALLDDAYLNARLWQPFQVQVGKYKSPVGLERLQSSADLLFIETGFATQLTPNYDLGASIHNSYFDVPLGYSIGIYNGAADATSDDADVTDEGKDVVGRLFAQPFFKTDIEPFLKLGFGVGGSIGNHSGALPNYKTAGQQTFFSYAAGDTANGRQYRLDPQAYYYWGPFGVEGEYILSSQKVQSTTAGVPALARFNNRAWQVEASYFLTGEENSFKYTSRQHVVPVHRLFNNGGWGAFEVVARLQQLSLDKQTFPNYAAAGSAREATSWGAGLNWYLNENVKLNLNYESTSFRGSPAPNAVTAKQEHIIFSRIQFQF